MDNTQDLPEHGPSPGQTGAAGLEPTPVGLVAIGASLGGFAALQKILNSLAANLPAAVAIVQHRSADAGSELDRLLAAHCPLPLREPDDKHPILAGHAYLAPADYHLLADGTDFSLSVLERVKCARPSIDVFFESVAESFGARAIGVVLTGASTDGAEGALSLARRGAHVLVQDPETAESPVAPRAALRCVPQAQVLPLGRIADVINGLCGVLPRKA